MKKILLLLLLFAGYFASGQVVIQRTPYSTIPIDQNLFTIKNFKVPVYPDTTTANLWMPKDSLGLVIQLRTGEVYHRDTTDGGHKWSLFGGNTGAVNSVFTRDGDVVALEGDYSSFYPLLSGSYDNPDWLNSLPAAKISGAGNLTAGSTKISLGGTPGGATLQNLSIDANEGNFRLQNIGGSLNVNQINATGTADATTVLFGNGTWGSPGGGGAGATNSNVGTGYRWAIPTTNNIKTLFGRGYIVIDSSTNTNGNTIFPDTGAFKLATKTDLTAYFKLSDSTTKGFRSMGYNDTRYAPVAAGVPAGGTANQVLSKINSTDYNSHWGDPIIPNPGVYISPAQSLDPSFIVFASCIAAVGNSYSVGDTVQWHILAHSTNHNSSFFSSVHSTVGNGYLYVEYPAIKTVMNLTITPDESFSLLGFIQGPSVGLTTAYAPVIQTVPNSLRLAGNGSGGWTLSGNTQGFNTSTGGGYAYLSPNITTNPILADPNQVSITYTGPHNYHINRLFSGLGSYTVFFELQDAGGNRVTTPATTDNVFVTNMGMRSSPCNMYIYNTTNAFLTTSYNFWVFGAFECWMVAAPVPSVSGNVFVRWQAYPAATGYKIYRDTHSDFSAQTLIYSGTDLNFTDTGLTPGTLYYYREKATLASVDTDITTFTTSPN